MREDAGAGDVGGLDGVGIAFATSVQELDELMNKMRVGASVASALGETQVLLSFLSAIDAAGGEGRDLFWKEVGVVWRFDK